jgi:hypothetical protein
MNVKRDFRPRLFELLHDPSPRQLTKSELRLLLWPHKKFTRFPDSSKLCDHWIDLTPEFRELLDLKVEDFPDERFYLLQEGLLVNRWMSRVENHIYNKYRIPSTVSKKKTKQTESATSDTPDTPTTPDTPAT